MNCSKCDAINDSDALFCANCGSALNSLAGRPRKTWRSYWYALLLVPVMLAAAGMGYYKFMLPSGVAAVVNDEEITIAELDSVIQSAMDGRNVPDEARGRMRTAALSEVITERIACQEARKAGISVTAEEMNDAIARMRSASDLDEPGFDAKVNSVYGGTRNFRNWMERRLMVRKFIDEKITSGISDPTIAGFRVNQWMEGATRRATVRVSLEEQIQGSAGCACCNGRGTGPAQQGSDPKAAGKQSVSQITAARDAAMAYWSKKNGSKAVETTVTDFGCHIQVDIVEKGKIAKSLRYQNSTITEM